MTKHVDRQRLIKLIHVAKRDIALDNDSYRAILQRIGKKTSAADLTVPELQQVLDYMKKHGFKVRSKAKPSRPLALDAESRKVRALWLFMHQLGVVQNPSEAALAAYVKRITGVDALQWSSGDQATALIETLKKWAMRFLPAAVEQLVQEVRSIPLSDEKRDELNAALSLAFRRQTFDPMHTAWECLTDVLNKAREKA